MKLLKKKYYLERGIFLKRRHLQKEVINKVEEVNLISLHTFAQFKTSGNSGK